MSRKIMFYVLFVVILCLGFSVTEVYSHFDYTWACCGNQHCHPITSCSEILENAKGVVWNGIQFTKDQIMPSQDTQCHVCIQKALDNTDIPRCVYVQQGS